MSPKSPTPSAYSSFAAIGIGTEVHLRLIGDDETVKPEYANAKLISEPTPTGPNKEFSARFDTSGGRDGIRG